MKLSLKRFSFLSLALIGVSAVTAAIIPSTKDNSYHLKSGTIIPSDDNGPSFTCAPRAAADSCFATVNSGTTGGDPETSEDTTFPDFA